jgi:hypothetical protein
MNFGVAYGTDINAVRDCALPLSDSRPNPPF